MSTFNTDNLAKAPPASGYEGTDPPHEPRVWDEVWHDISLTLVLFLTLALVAQTFF